MPEFDQPLVSVDVVPVRYDHARANVEVLLGRRIYEPHLGEFALPGVLLGHERIDEAAVRALRSKLGVAADQVRLLGGVEVFDNPDRDPRGPTLSIARYAVIDDDYRPRPEHHAAVALSAVDALPFDHDRIVTRAAEVLAKDLWADRAVAAALLGPRFATSDLREVYTQLLTRAHGDRAPHVDPANLLRRLRGTGWVHQVATADTGRGGRPPTVWEWND